MYIIGKVRICTIHGDMGCPTQSSDRYFAQQTMDLLPNYNPWVVCLVLEKGHTCNYKYHHVM